MRNSGPGIPDELAARLSQPFSAGDVPHSSGLGLGLAICLEIVRALGASIALQNRLVNGGVMGLGAAACLPLVQNEVSERILNG